MVNNKLLKYTYNEQILKILWVTQKRAVFGFDFDVTTENTTIASESLSGEITGKTYETKKIHT